MSLFMPDLDTPRWQRLSNDPTAPRFRAVFSFVKRKAGEYCGRRGEFQYRDVEIPRIIEHPQKKNGSLMKIYREAA
jgi:hypothetical protein